MTDLFSTNRPELTEIYADMFLLANFVDSALLLTQINEIIKIAPFRRMMTANGHKTAIALTNCGDYGWISDLDGYRYSAVDPQTNRPWPAMPSNFIQLATKAAAKVGYSDFIADACLINQYPIGSKLNSHQDKNERNFDWPIVSVSIGLTAVFQVFGEQRGGKPVNIQLHDGDLMVWGGKSRLVYHGVSKIKADPHQPSLTQRFNLTFRKAV